MSKNLPDEWEVRVKLEDGSTTTITLEYEHLSQIDAMGEAFNTLKEDGRNPIAVLSVTRIATADQPKVVNEPHYRYPDWPGKTTIYYEQGVARLQNMHDGAHLFIAVGGSIENNACLTLAETEHLYEQLGLALEEQRQLVAKEAEWQRVLGPAEQDAE